ncbi:MAG: hypothetical protein IIV58_03240 [Alistipes sp.]|nr:hypothetical protein [Alistipes sp.]
MQHLTKISLFFAMATMVACQELPDYMVGSNTVARVGKKELNISEIQAATPAGLTGADSISFTKLYIDKWLVRQLKLEEAEQLFSEAETDIERLVEDYRQSLLMRKVDQHHIDEQLSEDFSEQDIADYYNSHKANFTLDRTLVKGRILCFDDDYRQAKKLKEQMAKASTSATADKQFTDICEKNDFLLIDNRTEWVNLADFVTHLPIAHTKDYSNILDRLGIQEMKDNNARYYFELTSVCRKGNVAPLEIVADNIRRILITQRRSEIIKNHEQSIVSSAFESGHARIYDVDKKNK